MSIRRSDLPNGLTVVTEAVPGSRSASFGCWVRVGSRDEPDRLAGVSHFLEHLLFKGTTTRSGREISEEIEAVGGEMNAHTGPEATAFYTRVPASAASLGLDLLVDVVTDPAFDDDDVESERQVILEELHQAEDEGDDRVHVLAQEALWGRHPLGREVLGDAETIGAMSHADIRRFFESQYHPADLFLVGAGAVDHDAVVAVGERLRSSGGPALERTPPRAVQDRPPVALLPRPLEQAHLALAWPALPADDPDRWAQALCNQILGGGLSSRLFQEIRERRGLAYSVFSSIAGYTDSGALIAYAGTGPERVGEVRRIIAELAGSMVADGVTEREWTVARGYLEGATLLGLEDAGAIAARLGHHLCTRGEVMPVEEQLSRLRAVTPEDVHRVAERVLGREPAVCGVGPLTETDLLG